MIINLLATWIPALLIAFLGVLKLLGNSRVVEEMSIAQQTRDLLVELADLLLDQLQVRQCHLHQSAVDRVPWASTQCIAQLRRRGTQALIGQGGQRCWIGFSICQRAAFVVHWRRADRKPDWIT